MWKRCRKEFKDTCCGERSVGTHMAPRKVRSITFKDSVPEKDRNVQYCDRIGCSGRIKYSQKINSQTTENSKCSRTFLHSSNGNKIIRNSSTSNSLIMGSHKKNCGSDRKLSSKFEFGPLEECLSSDAEVAKRMSSPGRSQTVCQSESKTDKPEEFIVSETGSSCSSSHSKPRRIFPIKSASHKQNYRITSSVRSVSKSSVLETSNDRTEHKCGRKNLKCNSTINAVVPSCSSSVSKIVRKNVMKRSSVWECNLARRGRKAAEASSLNGRMFPSTSSILISNPRRSCNTAEVDQSASATVRTHKPVNTDNSLRLSNGRNGSCNGDTQSTLMHSPSNELGLTHLRNLGALQRYDLDGISEILWALERIDEDEWLTNERVLTLESDFLLRGLNLYDQHRELRLDIDNMSYEELLALEERMGTVSTAISEEMLPKCLRRSTYHESPSKEQATRSSVNGDDVKCSICQDELMLGDEIGTLVECRHQYHLACINQWLHLKNWCPICKTSAAPAESS